MRANTQLPYKYSYSGPLRTRFVTRASLHVAASRFSALISEIDEVSHSKLSRGLGGTALRLAKYLYCCTCYRIVSSE